MAVMVVDQRQKKFKNENSGEFVCSPSTKFPELLLRFLPLAYHQRHSLTTTLDFMSFHPAFWGYTLFSQLGCFCMHRYHSFAIA